VLLLSGRRGRVVEHVPQPDGGPDKRSRRRLMASWGPGGLAESSTPSAENFVASCEVWGGR
jgi:hypothetical protein